MIKLIVNLVAIHHKAPDIERVLYAVNEFCVSRVMETDNRNFEYQIVYAVEFDEHKPSTESLEYFKNLLSKHDFNYNYTDDHRRWKQGLASERKLNRLLYCLGDEALMIFTANTNGLGN